MSYKLTTQYNKSYKLIFNQTFTLYFSNRVSIIFIRILWSFTNNSIIQYMIAAVALDLVIVWITWAGYWLLVTSLLLLSPPTPNNNTRYLAIFTVRTPAILTTLDTGDSAVPKIEGYSWRWNKNQWRKQLPKTTDAGTSYKWPQSLAAAVITDTFFYNFNKTPDKWDKLSRKNELNRAEMDH